MKKSTLIIIGAVELWLLFILMIWLKVYSPMQDPKPAGESPAVITLTEITLTEDNWLDYFTVDCRQEVTTYASPDISPMIHLEYHMVPRETYADRLVYNGSALRFDVRYNENFGIFPVDPKDGCVLDDGAYSTVSRKEAEIAPVLVSKDQIDGTLIASTMLQCSDDDRAMGIICNSFEVTAADGELRIIETELPIMAADDPAAAAKGITGNVRWKLDMDGVLTVYGEGNMASRNNGSPWEAYQDDIRRVVIEDGVFNIGARAFEHTPNLEEVEIGDTVSLIGDGAFFCCPKLRHVFIPAAVHTIGKQAFTQDTMLSSIEIDPGNPNYTSTGSTIYNKDLTRLICCVEDSPTFQVPEGVTEISIYAFRDQSELNQVELPNTMTLIEESAFLGCSNLKTVIYHGTPEEWEAISIGEKNDVLTSAELICTETGSRPARSEMNTVLDDGELKVQYKDQSLLMELSGIEVEETYLLDRTGSFAGLSEYLWSIEFSDGNQTYKMGTTYYTQKPGENRKGSIDDMTHHFLVRIPDTTHDAFRSLAEVDVQTTENSICWRAKLPEDGSIDYDSIDSFHVEIIDFVENRQSEKRHYRPADLTEPFDRAVGRTLYMGHYEQNDRASDGVEPIEWIVLAVEQDRALLMSCYGLDCVPYQEHWESEIHWSSCDLRKWLNEGFYRSAFTDEERNSILPMMLANTDDLKGDYYTDDCVFLLSFSEAEQYVEEKEYAMCVPSEYAIGKGASDILREEYW